MPVDVRVIAATNRDLEDAVAGSSLGSFTICSRSQRSRCPRSGSGENPTCATIAASFLRAALGFAGLPRPSYDRSLWALRTRLDSWSGVGRVAVGMAHQGYDLQLTRYDARGWRGRIRLLSDDGGCPTSTSGR